MRRRAFITGVGGAAFAWQLAAHAQQPSRSQPGKRIGVLLFGSPGTEAILVTFLQSKQHKRDVRFLALADIPTAFPLDREFRFWHKADIVIVLDLTELR